MGQYNLRILTCEWCGSISEKRVCSRVRFCSRNCASQAKGAKKRALQNIEVNCDGCGKKIRRILSDIKSGRRLFCSKLCFDNFQRTVKSSFVCIICGNQFDVGITAVKLADLRYCSNQCQYNDPNRAEKVIKPGTCYKVRTITCDGCGKIVTGRISKNRRFCTKACAGSLCVRVMNSAKERSRTVNCESCGKEILRTPSNLRTYKYHFCDKACYDVFQREGKWDSEFKQKRADNIRRVSFAQKHKVGLNLLELAGRHILEDLGLSLNSDFFEQKELGYHCVDVFLPAYKVIIEWDGDYWHGNPEIYAELDATQRNSKRNDKAKSTYFGKRGYILLRFWEQDIKNNPSLVKQTIREAMIGRFSNVRTAIA